MSDRMIKPSAKNYSLGILASLIATLLPGAWAEIGRPVSVYIT